MRKFIITLAAAATTLAVAAPASAQYAPAYRGRSYAAPYGNAYGYGSANLQRQLQQIRGERNNLARSGRLTRSEARDLDRDIASAERAIYRAGRNGMSRYEVRSIRNKLARIQNEVRRYSDYDRRGNRYGNRYGRRY